MIQHNIWGNEWSREKAARERLLNKQQRIITGIDVPKIIKQRNYKTWTKQETDIILKYNPEMSTEDRFLKIIQHDLPYRTLISIDRRIRVLKYLSDRKYNTVAGLNNSWTNSDDKLLYDITKDEAHPMSDKFISEIKETYFPEKGWQSLKSRMRIVLNRK
jgi:hypothetical protein